VGFMGDCFTVPDNTKHPSLAVQDAQKLSQNEAEQPAEVTTDLELNKNDVDDNTNAAASNSSLASSDEEAVSRSPSNSHRNRMNKLTKKVDYNAAINASKAAEDNGNNKEDGNDPNDEDAVSRSPSNSHRNRMNKLTKKVDYNAAVNASKAAENEASDKPPEPASADVTIVYENENMDKNTADDEEAGVDGNEQEQTEQTEQEQAGEDEPEAPSMKPAASNAKNRMQKLTKKVDYAAAIEANKAEEKKEFKRNEDHDMEIVYKDDGVSIDTKVNGVTVNEYGMQTVDEALARDDVLEDMLTT